MVWEWFRGLGDVFNPRECWLCGKKGKVTGCCNHQYCPACHSEHMTKFHTEPDAAAGMNYPFPIEPEVSATVPPVHGEREYTVRDPGNKGSMQYTVGKNPPSKPDKRQKDLEDGWRD